ARAADETDARARVVELTDAGRAVIGPAFARHAEYLDDIFGDMTDEERTSLLALLLKLRSQTRQGR
ncbi:MAG TPA: hypothetical protein VFG89_04065, partial [Coriobacteriia bacterium]|nr:hypothetical protein [Coriobacteriia bacterium]